MSGSPFRSIDGDTIDLQEFRFVAGLRMAFSTWLASMSTRPSSRSEREPWPPAMPRKPNRWDV